MNKKRQRLIAAALRWQAAMDEADGEAYEKESELLLELACDVTSSEAAELALTAACVDFARNGVSIGARDVALGNAVSAYKEAQAKEAR